MVKLAKETQDHCFMTNSNDLGNHGSFNRVVHIIGFGSQASAWAQCLRTSGWDVQVYTPQKSRSYEAACALGFSTQLITELPKSLQNHSKNFAPSETTHWIAALCPDSAIPKVYDEWIAPCPDSVRLILAHGYAIYSSELKLKSPKHQATLLAPKAIGPKLLQNFQSSFPNPHGLVAAVFADTSEDENHLSKIARGMGFDSKNLIRASFDQETIGDLISEQGLLCGGVFNLLAWTMEEMAQAGVPDALIREECLTELELIAGLIRERGPASTFRAISQAAQAGTIAMAHRFEEAGLRKHFQNQTETVKNRSFSNFFNSFKWKKQASDFMQKLENWEIRFRRE
jgi:ketol-acid reductoisomerase